MRKYIILLFLYSIAYGQSNKKDNINKNDSISDFKNKFNNKVNRILLKDLKYPQKAIEEEIEGVVYLTLFFNEEGAISGFKTDSESLPLFINEVEKIFNKLKNNKVILAKKSCCESVLIPVVFSLDGNIKVDNEKIDAYNYQFYKNCKY
jgi:hypothetical protein